MCVDRYGGAASNTCQAVEQRRQLAAWIRIMAQAAKEVLMVNLHFY
jgi:hypothetical protein